MLFNSMHFLIFFIIVIFVYYILPHSIRWILLLVASYYFYMSWNPKYIVLIIISTLIDYFVAILIGKTDYVKKKKAYLGISLFSNLGLLFIFKYFNFFSESIMLFLQKISIEFPQYYLNVLLPVGISFYTFQTLSYTIDVYKGKIKPEKHLGIFAVYVSFFPQLVAGPIERAIHLLPQFRKKHYFNYNSFITGLKLMLWGFFLKLVIADRIAIIVNNVYNNVHNFSGFPLILASLLFAYQIFCDFAGYSLIAIGCAQTMGYSLMENFRRPYFSKSIHEFWTRWHISLSTWFKDYVYIPLGGNRVKKFRWYLNLFIVFFISGLWHGANWTFIIWGALHGLYLVFGIFTSEVRKFFCGFIGLNNIQWLHNLIKIIITFILVNIGWIFFRANNLSDALYIITHLFTGLNWASRGEFLGSIGTFGLLIIVFAIFILELKHFIEEFIKNQINDYIEKYYLKPIFYSLILIFTLIFGVFQFSEFIYFQF